MKGLVSTMFVDVTVNVLVPRELTVKEPTLVVDVDTSWTKMYELEVTPVRLIVAVPLESVPVPTVPIVPDAIRFRTCKSRYVPVVPLVMDAVPATVRSSAILLPHFRIAPLEPPALSCTSPPLGVSLPLRK